MTPAKRLVTKKVLARKNGRTPAATEMGKPGIRGPKPAHSRMEIARVAVEIADAEGLQAVTMRRIATTIGSAAPSLYRYVANKGELMDLMVEFAMAKYAYPVLSDDWRQDLTAIATNTRALFNRHPWLISFSPWRPTAGPNSMAVNEATFCVLDRESVAIEERPYIVSALWTFVRGHVSDELTEARAQRESGLDHSQWVAAHDSFTEAIRAAGTFPCTLRVVEHARQQNPQLAEKGFYRSLTYFLDGIASRMRTPAKTLQKTKGVGKATLRRRN